MKRMKRMNSMNLRDLKERGIKVFKFNYSVYPTNFPAIPVLTIRINIP